MKRRILTLLLTLVMVLSLLPGTALAVNDSSAPAVTYADLADINGTALVPDGAGENTELTVADAVRALLLWTGMTEQQLGSFPDDYLAQARSMGMMTRTRRRRALHARGLPPDEGGRRPDV